MLLILYGDYITCLGYFRLSVNTWGFFSHIYISDSRRDSVFMYFEKRDVTDILLEESLVDELSRYLQRLW